MNKYSSKDTQLLSEAYSVQLLREHAPNIKLKDLTKRYSLMNESELTYMNDVQERILNEFWGGLKNVFGAGKDAAQKGTNAVKQAGGAALNKAKQVGTQAVNTAKQVGSGLASAGSQVASNVSDIYTKGNVSADSNKAMVKAQQSAQQLIDLLNQAVQQGTLSLGGNSPSDLTLAEIIDYLSGSKDAATQNAQTARSKGFTGGVGGAFKQGFNS